MTIYEKEYRDFEKNFAQHKSKRIVLYGTGRHTATIIPLLSGNWNIIGLMDRNQDYIGQIMYGLPVLDWNEVRSKADLIIINTAGAYWSIIYQRIRDIGLPIYYQNGQMAKGSGVEEEDIEYWRMTKDSLIKEIDRHEIISFDFYDTLFQRKIYLPSEVFEMTAVQCVSEGERRDFNQIRKSAGSYIDDPYVSLDTIYEIVQSKMHWTDEKREDVKAKETEIEQNLLMPRKDISEALQYALGIGKEVYIISDMYLPVDFYIRILSRYHIPVRASHIWVSCEKDASKEDGMIWEMYRRHIGDKTALHIGDHLKDDIQNAHMYHIDTCYCMNKNELMAHSSMHRILPHACSEYHMMVLGLCESKLFGGAFDLGKTNGKINISKRKDFGYTVLGPVICTFVLWLMNQVVEDGTKHLFFLGRDGYFLLEDFGYMMQLMGISFVDSRYLETSRQILMCVNLQSEEDFMEYLKYPYKGSIHDYMTDRFELLLQEADEQKFGDRYINSAQDFDLLRDLLRPYENEIRNYLSRNKKNYLHYLQSLGLTKRTELEHTAVVDLGYYGTNQYLLSRALGQSIKGYYVMADLSDDNKNCKENKMVACACDESSKNAQSMNIGVKDLILESFLTSPCGMVKGMPDEKTFLYDEGKRNQKFFEDKIEINEGIKEFLKDMAEYHIEELRCLKDVKIDSFIDQWYGTCLDYCIMDDCVKRSFYNDNAFIHRGEEKVME